jgi:TonB family protein
LGGSGGGTSIGNGNGPGSGLADPTKDPAKEKPGPSSGAASTGPGKGANADAHGGISPTNGPGGAGNSPAANPPVRGVDVSGGSSIVTLPSFGDDPAANDHSANDPAAAAKSAARKPREGLNVTVVATASSGGAFEPYKNLLHGEKYTTYIETSLGTAVMEFSDESATSHPFGGTITAPAPIETALADGLPHARMVISCTVDVSGKLKNVRVLEAGPAGMTAKVVASLRTWKFEPATRNKQPVEVTAILGFGIDTNDRF